jgi:hypothetical protein
MAIVSTESLQLGHVEEVVPGTTPANPVFQLWRTTGEGLVFAPQTTESAELGGTGRMKKPANVTGMSVSGDINFELSKFTALEEAIEGVLASAWGQCPLTGAQGGAIDSANRVTTGGSLKTYTVEKRFANPSFVRGDIVSAAITTAAPGATADITVSAPASGTYTGTGMLIVDVTVDGGSSQHVSVPVSVGDTEAAAATALATALTALSGMSAAAVGGVVTITPDTATVDALTLTQGQDEFFYQRFKGVTYSSMTLDVAPNQPVTGSFGLIGGTPELDVVPIAGATYVAAGNNPVFTAPDVSKLQLGTLTAGTHCFTSLTISIDSQNRGIACLGTQGEREVVAGTLRVEVNGSVYFSDQDILEKLLDDQKIGDGTIALTDGSGNYYRFDFYGLKPTAAQVSAGGQGQDLIVPITLQPTPHLVCIDAAGDLWNAGMVISRDNTTPTNYCKPSVTVQTIPVVAGTVMNITPTFATKTVFHVNWGDGIIDRYKISGATVSHTYATAFTGNVLIIGCA